jgi:hypothetical protein
MTNRRKVPAVGDPSALNDNDLLQYDSASDTVNGIATGSVGITDHGALSGLGDDDHTQYLLRSVVTTKGDLLTATGSATITRRAVGTDGHVLIADSAEADGVKWGAAPAGTPATTVTDETSWGVAAAVGVDSEYARQDHTHGSPADPSYTDAEAIAAVEGEATLELSGAVDVAGNLDPNVDSTSDFGETAKRWATGYLDTVITTTLGGNLASVTTAYITTLRATDAGSLTLRGGTSTNVLLFNSHNFIPDTDGVSALGATGARWSDMFTDLLTITRSAAPTPTTDGQIALDSTYDEIRIGDGAATLAYTPVGDYSDQVAGSPGTSSTAREANADQIFSSTGTWTKPSGNYTFAKIICIGGGGGGGSGRRGANGSKRVGGAGGGGGGVTVMDVPFSDMASSYTVTIGAGGAGGAGHSSNSTNGNGGSNGGDTWVGSSAAASICSAGGGLAGAGGQDSERNTSRGGEGTYPGGAGGAGQDGGGNVAGSMYVAWGGGDNGSQTIGYAGGAGGGGGAGGVTTGDAENAGGAGGAPGQAGAQGTYAGGSASGSAGTAGGDFSGAIGLIKAGGGGGGGAGHATGAHASSQGGAGGLYGGGGGGSGAQNNSSATKAGGAGADGYCRIICY